jgi:hypothetical protein
MLEAFDEIFRRFADKSPLSVMVRACTQRVLSACWLDDFFERTAQKQYTRKLLFSMVFGIMARVVLCSRLKVHRAFQEAEQVNVSPKAFYDKLAGIEPGTSAALVREVGREVGALIEQIGGACQPWLAGVRVRVVDGNCIAATQHRLKELRQIAAPPLPGKSIVLYDPALEVVVDVIPCEDGHAQERSLVGELVSRLEENDLAILDRNFCTTAFLDGAVERNVFFAVRHHANLPLHQAGPQHHYGRTQTGSVLEQPVEVLVGGKRKLRLRCVTVRLDKPTRNGDLEVRILTNLPASLADPHQVATLYLRRWSIETAFQKLERDFQSEIDTLAYPKAAIFAFCIALVAFNLLAAVYAALRKTHGEQLIQQEFSAYYFALELDLVRTGMMIAIPEADWQTCAAMPPAGFAALLLELAARVNLRLFRKNPVRPKKPRTKRIVDPKVTHVSTARILAARTKPKK